MGLIPATGSSRRCEKMASGRYRGHLCLGFPDLLRRMYRS
ncbi:unnamed protein product [Arabidopsis lyrata]|nr:unnamed protein product [Arabidopsis lyrata]